MNLALVLAACTPDDPPSPAVPLPCPYDDCVPEATLPPGDADAGYDALINGDYMSCGFPASLFESYPVLFPGEPLPGRAAEHAALSYEYNITTSADGVEVVNKNCLSCHASYLNGTLVIGLGNVLNDSSASVADAIEIARGLVSDPAELAELDKLALRATVIDQYPTDTIGMSRGDTLVHAFLAHLDPVTLTWSDAALVAEPLAPGIPIDPPPWWRMSKKNAMFYNATIRGDWSKWAINEAFACLDGVAEAEAIVAYSPDVAAFLAAVEPPAYPEAIDAGLASEGEGVFVDACARCHGTQGPTGQYLNAVIPIDEVGTDPTMADAAVYFDQMWDEVISLGETFSTDVAWEPAEGYVAPPLDGIWATAPFLHNGSVPTLALLLESDRRPTYWKRTSLDSSDYDYEEVGWRYEELASGKDGLESAEAFLVYDTTFREGYANTGHVYGDALTDAQRSAVIEYLKTL